MTPGTRACHLPPVLGGLLLFACLAPVLSAAKPYHKRPRPAAHTQRAGRRWVKSLRLREKVAQLVVIPFYGANPHPHSREYRHFVRLIRDVRVGGMILVNVNQGKLVRRAEPHALAAFLNRMQRLAKIPLLVSADFERGASMRVDGTTRFPHAMAFAAAGDPADTRYLGEVTARESRAMGVHWIFFPVADVNNNADNPIINIRSFGENPQEVARHVEAFIEGARSDAKNRVLTTAKHFPGHGDTAMDTHLNLAVITGDRDRLQKLELVPFQAAIRAGVDAIMTAHIAVPALDRPDLPASLSSAVLTKLLRDELGFHGIVVTDALDMGSVVKNFGTGEAAVRAIEAGTDVLLMPPDAEEAINAVVAAVRSGRLSEKRIDQSASRILAVKNQLGLQKHRLVDLETIADIINSPEANERAQQVADRAVALLKNQDNLIPLRSPASTCFLILAEDRSSSEGQALIKELRRGAPAAEIVLLDPSMPAQQLEESARKAGNCAAVVVCAFVSVGAYRGNVALPGEYPKLLAFLIESGKPVALVALGNPYLLRSFPKVSAYLATYSTVALSEIAAVKALLGEIPIQGRPPVTIPDHLSQDK